MKRSSGIIFVVLGLAACLGLCAVAATDAAKTREAPDGLARRRTELNLGNARLKTEVNSRRRDLARLRTALAGMRTPPAELAVQPAAHPFPTVLIGHPKLFALYLRFIRAGLGRRFQPLYHSLELTPAQIASFENLMTAHREAMVALQAAAGPPSGRDADPAMADLWRGEEEQFNLNESALLGADGYAQFQALNRAEGGWAFADSIATRVIVTSQPLSEAQGRALASIIGNAIRPGEDPAAANFGPASIAWDRVLPAAQAILSETQMSVLKTLPEIARVSQLADEFYQQQGAR